MVKLNPYAIDPTVWMRFFFKYNDKRAGMQALTVIKRFLTVINV